MGIQKILEQKMMQGKAMKLEDQIFENLQLRGTIASLEAKLVESELKDKQNTEKIKALEAQIANLNMKLSFTGGYRCNDEKQRQKRDERSAAIRAKYGLSEKEYQVSTVSKKSLLSKLFR